MEEVTVEGVMVGGEIVGGVVVERLNVKGLVDVVDGGG